MMTPNKEEQVAYQNYEDALKQAHEQITELTYANSKKNSLWIKRVFFIVIGSLSFMGILQWNYGYTVAKAIRVVPSDAPSGAELYEQVKDEIEVNHLLRGLIRDNVIDLEKSKSILRIRDDGDYRGATFVKDLSAKERTEFIQAAYSLQQINTLNWIKEQPHWDKGITKDIADLVVKGPERYKGKTAKDWRNKYYTLKQHHYSDEHGSEHEELKIVKNELDVSQSKLNAALAFIHDNPYYYRKVDLSHLGLKWDNYYSQHLDKAPNLKKYLFQTEKDTSQSK